MAYLPMVRRAAPRSKRRPGAVMVGSRRRPTAQTHHAPRRGGRRRTAAAHSTYPSTVRGCSCVAVGAVVVLGVAYALAEFLAMFGFLAAMLGLPTLLIAGLL